MYLDVALEMRYDPVRNSSSRTGDALRKALQRLRTCVGHTKPESADTAVVAALQARLESLEEEIDRVTRLASQERDIAKQEAYLALARDLQREARMIREQIRLHNG